MALDIVDLDPRVQKALEAIQADAAARGIKTHVTSGARTYQDQAELYANFQAEQRGEPLPYPARGAVAKAAPPGSSLHEKGLAFDLQADDRSRQAELESLGASHGLSTISGDPGHFQLGSTLAKAVGTTGYLQETSVNPNARGMRNNNPGNLVANSWTAGLPGYKGSDGRFAIFDTPEHGMAALDTNLTSYGSKGLNTPLKIASTWAPAGDNNDPNSYGARIAKKLGVGPNDTVDMNDPKVRARIASAIAEVENGPGNASVVASTSGGGGGGAPPTSDWQSLLGAEPPPALADVFGGGAVDGSGPPTAYAGGAGVDSEVDASPPPVDLAYAPASTPAEELGARYAQHKEARQLKPLSDLFTLKTIGQPPQKTAAVPTYGRIG